MEKRVAWIDVLKAVAIILVVCGHAWGCPKWVMYYIYSFHIPLFFFLSGTTMRGDTGFFEYFKKIAKGLLKPYLFYTLLYTMGLSLFYDKDVLANRSFVDFLFCNLLLLPGKCSYGMWFLMVLIMSKIVCYPILRFINNDNSKIILLLALVALTPFLISSKLPLGGHVVVVATSFLLLGSILKNYWMNIKRHWLIVAFGGQLINFCIVFSNIYCGESVDLILCKYGGTVITFYIGTYAGILSLMALVIRYESHLKNLAIIGKHTLRIYCTHYYVLWLLNNFVFCYFENISHGANLYNMVCIVLAVGICLKYSEMINAAKSKNL